MSILIASFVYKYLKKKQIIHADFDPQKKLQVAYVHIRTGIMNMF